jgi:hypothetical protein
MTTCLNLLQDPCSLTPACTWTDSKGLCERRQSTKQDAKNAGATVGIVLAVVLCVAALLAGAAWYVNRYHSDAMDRLMESDAVARLLASADANPHTP